jgi:hypothetical protein
MMQQPQAHASALAVAHPHDPAGGDAPPKQVAQAMERLGRAGRLIADIRLGADRLLEALFVSGDAPPYSVRQHVDRMEHIIVKEDAAMRLHFQDLRALGRYQPPASPPALTPPFSLPYGSRRLGIVRLVVCVLLTADKYKISPTTTLTLLLMMMRDLTWHL